MWGIFTCKRMAPFRNCGFGRLSPPFGDAAPFCELVFGLAWEYAILPWVGAVPSLGRPGATPPTCVAPSSPESMALQKRRRFSPAVPDIQNRRRIPRSGGRADTTRAKLPTSMDILTRPRDESVRNTDVAYTSTNADVTRDDYSAPHQKGESEGDKGTFSSLRDGYKGEVEGSNSHGRQREGPPTLTPEHRHPIASSPSWYASRPQTWNDCAPHRGSPSMNK